jgi:hypothetical protein
MYIHYVYFIQKKKISQLISNPFSKIVLSKWISSARYIQTKQYFRLCVTKFTKSNPLYLFQLLSTPFASSASSTQTNADLNSTVVPVKSTTPCQDSSKIKLNPDTRDPDKAWDKVKIHAIKEPVERMKLDEPVYPNKIRFVCISDTHSKLDQMQHEIPNGDVLLHAGDFTNMGRVDDVQKFSEQLLILNAKFTYKVVIAGNHELTFDPESRRGMLKYIFSINLIIC